MGKIHFLLVLVVALCSLIPSVAQFGIKQAVQGTGDAAAADLDVDATRLREFVQAANEAAGVDESLVQLLLERVGGAESSGITEQQAVDVSYLLQKVRQDPESILLLQQLKAGTGQYAYNEFVKDGMPESDIVKGLVVALEELKLLDFLFKDPKRAFVEMSKEGLIEQRMLKTYEKDPALLEEDTRKGLFFSFLALGAKGGYL